MRTIIVALLLMPAAHAEGVHFTVDTRDHQSTFRIGEVIPLTLSFSSTSPKSYQINTATSNRAGRLYEETYAVEPQAGWDDPLDLYYRSWSMFAGGGLMSFNILSEKPVVIHADLNEWVRFSKPGQYRVTVKSQRVSRVGARLGDNGTEVTSNELLVRIVPATAQWQRETLARAVAVLNGPGPAADERRQAIKTLRYLGTRSAARELARHLSEPDLASDCEAGIAGSPAREAVLDDLRTMLRDPDFAVSDRFLSTIAMAALPANAEGDIAAQREALETGFRQELAAVLSSKRNAALAMSANTLVEEAAIRSRELPPELKRKTTEALVAHFDKLPADKQAELIEFRWQALDHEAMLPVIRRMARRYQDFSELREIHAFESNNASGAALRYWYEAEPDAARPTVIEEISRPKPRFNGTVLGMLPDKELPEVDGVLAEHLRESTNLDASGNLASLIHRYASRAIEAQVSGYLDEQLGKMACAIQEPLLAYLVKQDPSAAQSRLAAAMAARGEGFSACNHSLLQEVGKLRNDPVLQEIAIPALDDPDPQVAGNAAAYLARYGTSAAEEPLWARFTAWSKRWNGREAEMHYIPGESMDLLYESGAGSNMMQALATAQGWLLDESGLQRLMDLSIGPSQRQQTEQYLAQWQKTPKDIQFIPVGSGQFQIAQYRADSIEAAKDKLRQFPKGSRFRWAGGGEGEEKAFLDLAAFGSGIGLEITRNPR